MLKLLKKLSSNHLVLAISGLVLLYAFYNYSNNKSLVVSGMQGGLKGSQNVSPSGNSFSAGASNVGANAMPAGVSGINTNGGDLPKPCARQETIDPSDLLPKENNSQFNQMSPKPDGNLLNVSLMDPNAIIGMQSQVLRNANLSLRADPPIPQTQQPVSPWLNTTIGRQAQRGVELGSTVA